MTSRSTISLSVTQPLSARRSLTGELVVRLTDDITSGKIPPGSRLPTEQEMIAATGVSRTVVREAVAALRAGIRTVLLPARTALAPTGQPRTRAAAPRHDPAAPVRRLEPGDRPGRLWQAKLEKNQA